MRTEASIGATLASMPKGVRAAGGDRASLGRPLASAPFEGLRRNYYAAITADPASHFSSYTAIQSQNWSSRRDNERHYTTMSLDAAAGLPVKDLASSDGCHLFVWSSGFARERRSGWDCWGDEVDKFGSAS